jgi:hypothetical protein
MSNIVYTLRSGTQEYTVTKERFEKMKAKVGAGAFNVVREEDPKQPRTPSSPSPAKVERVQAAPRSPAKAAKQALKNGPKQATPKEVRTPAKVEVKPAPTDELKDQSPE